MPTVPRRILESKDLGDMESQKPEDRELDPISYHSETQFGKEYLYDRCSTTSLECSHGIDISMPCYDCMENDATEAASTYSSSSDQLDVERPGTYLTDTNDVPPIYTALQLWETDSGLTDTWDNLPPSLMNLQGLDPEYHERSSFDCWIDIPFKAHAKEDSSSGTP